MQGMIVNKTRRWWVQRGQHLCQRGFAGTVFADNEVGLTLRSVKSLMDFHGVYGLAGETASCPVAKGFTQVAPLSEFPPYRTLSIFSGK